MKIKRDIGNGKICQSCQDFNSGRSAGDSAIIKCLHAVGASQNKLIEAITAALDKKDALAREMVERVGKAASDECIKACEQLEKMGWPDRKAIGDSIIKIQVAALHAARSAANEMREGE